MSNKWRMKNEIEKLYVNENRLYSTAKSANEMFIHPFFHRNWIKAETSNEKEQKKNGK